MKRLAKTIVALAFLALPGCGSSGTASDAGGRGGAGGAGAGGAAGKSGVGGHDAGAPTGEITWLDDGTPHAIAVALAARRTTTMSDNLEIVGVDTQGSYSLSIALGSATTLGGTYSCPFDGGDVVEITYMLRALEPTSCSVTVAFTTESGAQHATGTFSFDVAGEAGVEAITDGHYDIPVSMEAP